MKLLIGAWLSLGSIWTIAAAETSGLDTGVAALIGNGVTVAVLAWYVIYDVRVRTPGMLDAFKKETAEMRATFTATLEEVRKSFEKEQADSRLMFISEQNASRQNFTQVTAASDTRHDREVSEYRKMLLDNMDAFRRAVHDVKNTADLAVKKRDLSTLEKESA